MNRWYWVKIAGLIDLHYLVSANTSKRACFKVAPNSENTTAELATWGSLEKYLCCQIPHGQSSKSIARGSIPFDCYDRRSHIHHSI